MADKTGGKEAEAMCQSDVYLLQGGEERLLMKDAAWLEAADETIIVRNDLGEEKTVRARLKVADLVQHRVVLEAVPSP